MHKKTAVNLHSYRCCGLNLSVIASQLLRARILKIASQYIGRLGRDVPVQQRMEEASRASDCSVYSASILATY